MANLRTLLDSIWRVSGRGTDLSYNLQTILARVREDNHSMGILLHKCFVFFVVLTSSTTLSLFDPLFEGDHLYTSPQFTVQRSRFTFILFLLTYFQNRLRGKLLEPFWFILHYRGLTNTGFSVLHNLGISPSVRSLPVLVSRIISESKRHCFDGCVWWCDNLRRIIRGFFPSLERQDWTVTGRTILPTSLPKYDPQFWAFGNVFTPQQLELCSAELLSADEILVSFSNTYFDNSTGFSVPIRSRVNRKYQFSETDVLPSACGTILGTITLLRYLSENSLQISDTYSICVLDYDLYWRVMKFYHTSSLWRPFELQQKKLVLLMGPWHIYKLLSEAIWRAFVGLVFAPMWLHIKEAKVPASPTLVDIITIFIAIANTTKSQPKWNSNQNSPVCRSIQLLMYHYIPLVRTFKQANHF